MKQDTNLGWTSYDFKSAPMPNEDTCKMACNANPNCDFYTYIDSIAIKCWCGEYKKPLQPINLDLLTVNKVTLKFKKGESDIFPVFKLKCLCSIRLFQMRIL